MNKVADLLDKPYCEHCFNDNFDELNYMLKPNGLAIYICDNCLELARLGDDYK